MGSSQSIPVLPSAINALHFLQTYNDNTEPAAVKFQSDIRDYGMAVFQMPDELVNAMRQYEEECKLFFALDQQDKDQFIVQNPDPLLAELGVKPNIGYMKQSRKEYLKLRLSDDEEMIPSAPENLKPAFQHLFPMLRDLAEKCYRCLAAYEVDGGTYVSDEMLESSLELGNDGASISVIHYWPTENEEAKDDDEQANDQEDHSLRLKIHEDTGILTMIRCAAVSGLHVEDRASGGYVLVEDMYPRENHIFVIVGKKIELMAQSEKVFSATKHKVEFSPAEERYSTLYFMDFRK